MSIQKSDLLFTKFMAALWGLVIILLLHRMPGIEHDARLYLAQGLFHQYSDIFSKDLFFLHGSQDKYTLFPRLLGWILSLADPFPVFLFGIFFGLLFFAVTSWYCLKTLLPAGQRYVAWIGILCLPSSYAVVSIFSYMEPFLTARIFAASFCLLAIVFVTQRKGWIALLCLFSSGLLHPLQTLVILPVIWFWLILKERSWLHAAWLIIPVILLALAKVHPLDGLFQKMDPFWLMAIKTSKHLLVSRWQAIDFNNLVFDILVLVLAWKRLPLLWSTWCQAALIALVLGITGSLVLVDWLHWVLPAGLQLWRVHWLAHWFAMASVALFLLRHGRKGQWLQAVLLILVVCLIWSELNWIWLMLMITYLIWPRLVTHLRQPILILLGVLFSLMIVLLYTWKMSSILNALAKGHDEYLPIYTIDFYLLCFPASAIGLALLGVYLWNKSNQHKRWLFGFILAPVLLWGGWQWDSRSEMQRAMAPLHGHDDVFGVSIPQNAQIQIYSEKDKDLVDSSALLSWYVLRRAHYFSLAQVAGQVFNRATAFEGYQRWQRLRALEDDVNVCRKYIKEKKYDCHMSAMALYDACDSTKTNYPLPPDYLVLPFAQPQSALGQWSIHNTRTGEVMTTYYLYSCAGLIEELQVEMEESSDNVEELSS